MRRELPAQFGEVMNLHLGEWENQRGILEPREKSEPNKGSA